jgi:hypothetical protein
MWDILDTSHALWQPGAWLADPRILGTFGLSVAAIALVEASGGPRAARFRLAVRLAPVAFVLPAVLPLLVDPILPTWLAYPITSFATAADPRALHEVVLALATPVAFVGVVFAAWWLATVPRAAAQVATVRSRIWLAIRVFLAGYIGASMAGLPLIGPIFGLFVLAPTLAVLMLPGLFVAVTVWSKALPVVVPGTPDTVSGRRRSLELGLIVASGIVAIAGLNALS